MKTMLGMLPLGLLLLGAAAPARAQTAPAPAPVTEMVLMKNGVVMAVKNGRTTPLSAALPLANGATVHPDGKLLLPDGQWLPLREGDQVKMDGMLVPAPLPMHRRVTRANKHVSADMMQRMP